MPGKFAEVFVESQQNPLFAYRPREHILIAHAGSRIPHPRNILPDCNQRRDGRTGEIFVGEEAHIRLR
jgi:hypothetical protein